VAPRRITRSFLWLALLSGAALGLTTLFGAQLGGPLPDPIRFVDGAMLLAMLTGVASAFGLILCVLLEIRDRLSGRLGPRPRNLPRTWQGLGASRYELDRVRSKPPLDEAPHEKLVREALEQAKREAFSPNSRAKAKKRKPAPRR